ncbi:MAG TPA: hypothetical protein VFU71_22430 [Burkholderiaceae bacterium]|nr:hypothetical protein [Burkholderiaceae bacterium]
MIFGMSKPSPANVADTATETFDHATQSARRVGDQALDNLSSTARDLREQAAPVLERAGEQVSALAQRGVDAVRERSLQMRERAARASDSTSTYIRDEPLKSVLIAAAAGAALMVLVGLLRKSA